MIDRIIIDRSRLRRWHLDLVSRLSKGRKPVSLVLSDGEALPSSVELILTLEKLIYRLPAPRASDRVENTLPSEGKIEGQVLDLSIAGVGGQGALRLCYDGLTDESALFGALLSGHVPVIELTNAEGTNRIACALPSVETAESLTEAYESVVARVNTLILSLPNPAMCQNIPAIVKAAPARPGAAIHYVSRQIAFSALRRLYRLCTRAPHWRVGWRHVNGSGVFDRGDIGGTPWNDLPNPGDRFLADPFPVIWKGETWVFAEDFEHRTQKGIISAVPFGEKGPTGSARPVLEMPWHLSYPFIIADGGEIWMIPESSMDRTVRLYRADPFPDRWVEEAVLLESVEASDATVVRHEGRYWMFSVTRDGAGAPSDTLSLFMADRLIGPWRPHPANPVLIDASAARPAGNMVYRDGRLWRPVQDCRNGYGRALGLAEVTHLDDERFSQTVHTLLRPGTDWPGRRIHTLNRAGSLECIDGSSLSLKTSKLLPRHRDKATAGLSTLASDNLGVTGIISGLID